MSIDDLKELFEEEENNECFGIWALMLLALMFSQPIKQEPPITNIYLGGDK